MNNKTVWKRNCALKVNEQESDCKKMSRRLGDEEVMKIDCNMFYDMKLDHCKVLKPFIVNRDNLVCDEMATSSRNTCNRTKSNLL